jgi:hypothetical protein
MPSGSGSGYAEVEAVIAQTSAGVLRPTPLAAFIV